MGLPVLSGRRVLVVSASMGAGHDRAARTLAGRLTSRYDADVTVVDLLALPRWRQGDLLRGFYREMVTRAPAAYDLAMRQWQRHPRFFEAVTSRGGGAYERPLLSRVADLSPHVVVSTFNLAAQLLGRLRRRGALGVPVVSYVTDPGAHPYWVARGVDVHAAPLAATASALSGMGATGAAVVAPVVGDPFLAAPDRSAARQSWQLPDEATVVAVNAGSWAVGGVAATAAALDGVPGVLPVVLCGRSERVAGRVRAEAPGARPVGWTDDVAGLLAAADVLVDNAGGLTCWEALATGTPVVLHRPLPGHGRLNVDTLVAHGLATYAPDDAALAAAVRVAPRPPSPGPFAERPLEDLVATLW